MCRGVATHGRGATCCSCCPRRSNSLQCTAQCNRGSSALSSPQSGRRHKAGASTSRARTRRRACRARSPPQTSGCATTRIGPQGTARAGTPPPCSRRRPHTACTPSRPRRPGVSRPRTACSARSPRVLQSCPGGTCPGRSRRRGSRDPLVRRGSLRGSWLGCGCCSSRPDRLRSFHRGCGGLRVGVRTQARAGNGIHQRHAWCDSKTGCRGAPVATGLPSKQ